MSARLAGWGMRLLLCLAATSLVAPERASAFSLVFKLGRFADEAADVGKLASRSSHLARLAARSPKLKRAALLQSEAGQMQLLKADGRVVPVTGIQGLGGKFSVAASQKALFTAQPLLIAEMDLAMLPFDDVLTWIRENPFGVAVLKESGEVRQFKLLQRRNDATSAVLEERPGVFARLTAEGLAPIQWAMSQNLARHQMKVYSLFDPLDGDILTGIGISVRELHRPWHLLPGRDLLAAIRSESKGIHVVVGHTEGEYFVIRSPSGSVAGRYKISELERASRDVEGTLILLGCRTGALSRASGFFEPVIASNVMRGLSEAISRQTVGEFFEAIAKHSGEMVLQPGVDDAFRSSIIAKPVNGQMRNAAGGAFTTVRATTVSQARAEDLSMRIIGWMPWYIPMLYIAGLLLIVMDWRRSWNHWKELWIDSPDPAISPLAHRLMGFARGVGFLTIHPFVRVWIIGYLIFLTWLSLYGLLFAPIAFICALGAAEFHLRHKMSDEPGTRFFANLFAVAGIASALFRFGFEIVETFRLSSGAAPTPDLFSNIAGGVIAYGVVFAFSRLFVRRDVYVSDYLRYPNGIPGRIAAGIRNVIEDRRIAHGAI